MPGHEDGDLQREREAGVQVAGCGEECCATLEERGDYRRKGKPLPYEAPAEGTKPQYGL